MNILFIIVLVFLIGIYLVFGPLRKQLSRLTLFSYFYSLSYTAWGRFKLYLSKNKKKFDSKILLRLFIGLIVVVGGYISYELLKQGKQDTTQDLVKLEPKLILAPKPELSSNQLSFFSNQQNFKSVWPIEASEDKDIKHTYLINLDSAYLHPGTSVSDSQIEQYKFDYLTTQAKNLSHLLATCQVRRKNHNNKSLATAGYLVEKDTHIGLVPYDEYLDAIKKRYNINTLNSKKLRQFYAELQAMDIDVNKRTDKGTIAGLELSTFDKLKRRFAPKDQQVVITSDYPLSILNTTDTSVNRLLTGTSSGQALQPPLAMPNLNKITNALSVSDAQSKDEKSSNVDINYVRSLRKLAPLNEQDLTVTYGSNYLKNNTPAESYSFIDNNDNLIKAHLNEITGKYEVSINGVTYNNTPTDIDKPVAITDTLTLRNIELSYNNKSKEENKLTAIEAIEQNALAVRRSEIDLEREHGINCLELESKGYLNESEQNPAYFLLGVDEVSKADRLAIQAKEQETKTLQDLAINTDDLQATPHYNVYGNDASLEPGVNNSCRTLYTDAGKPYVLVSNLQLAADLLGIYPDLSKVNQDKAILGKGNFTINQNTYCFDAKRYFTRLVTPNNLTIKNNLTIINNGETLDLNKPQDALYVETYQSTDTDYAYSRNNSDDALKRIKDIESVCRREHSRNELSAVNQLRYTNQITYEVNSLPIELRNSLNERDILEAKLACGDTEAQKEIAKLTTEESQQLQQTSAQELQEDVIVKEGKIQSSPTDKTSKSDIQLKTDNHREATSQQNSSEQLAISASRTVPVTATTKENEHPTKLPTEGKPPVIDTKVTDKKETPPKPTEQITKAKPKPEIKQETKPKVEEQAKKQQELEKQTVWHIVCSFSTRKDWFKAESLAKTVGNLLDPRDFKTGQRYQLVSRRSLRFTTAQRLKSTIESGLNKSGVCSVFAK